MSNCILFYQKSSPKYCNVRFLYIPLDHEFGKEGYSSKFGPHKNGNGCVTDIVAIRPADGEVCAR